MYNSFDIIRENSHIHSNGYSPISSSPYHSSMERSTSSTTAPDAYNNRGHAQLQQHSQPNHHSQSNMRYGQFSRHNTMASSLVAIDDSMSEIVIDDLPNENESTSAILEYCKKKFLRPYVTILSLVGLNPITTDSTTCKSFLSYVHAFVIFIVICAGYAFMYLISFRGDRGFASHSRSKTSYLFNEKSLNNFQDLNGRELGEFLFAYVIPYTLNLSGFLSAIVVFKIIDNEHLQNLVERVFLTTPTPKRLCITLWSYVVIGFIWLIIQMTYIVLHITSKEVIKMNRIGVMANDYQFLLKALLIVNVFIHDTAHIIIILTYSIECLLLRVQMCSLTQKLVQHSIANIEWMKEILEFRKILTHLNNRVSLPVCFLSVTSLSYSFAGIVYLFKDFDLKSSPMKLTLLNVANVFFWLCMGILPFFQAATLTRVCSRARDNGHQIRARPFVYNNANSDDLNSTLLFASSLNMSAKLFRIPIQINYLAFSILTLSIFILTLGMCINLPLGFI